MLLLVILFMLVPIAEIYVIIQVGQAIGALWTVLILIVDSLIGARLLSWQGRRAWAAFQSALTAGRIPHREVLDGVLIILGGAFLLTPGLHHRRVGLLLLIPPTRAAFRAPADPHDAAPDPPRVGARGRRGAGRAAATATTHRAPDTTAATGRAAPGAGPAAAMTVPGDEQAQTGPGEFRDVVDVQLLDESLLVAARIARSPSAGSASVTALVIADAEPVVEVAEEIATGVDSWEHAVAGPLQLTIEQPLERWRLLLDAPGARIELELQALTAPAGLAEPATSAAGRAAGVHRYAQLCVATRDRRGRRAAPCDRGTGRAGAPLGARGRGEPGTVPDRRVRGRGAAHGRRRAGSRRRTHTARNSWAPIRPVPATTEATTRCHSRRFACPRCSGRTACR